MVLEQLLVAIIVIVLLLYLIPLLPIPESFKRIARIIVLLIGIFWLLEFARILPPHHLRISSNSVASSAGLEPA